MEQRVNPRLELDEAHLRTLGQEALELVIQHLVGMRDEPVTGVSDRASREAALREPVPEEGTDPQQVLELLRREVLPYITHADHPRFFAFVPSPSNALAVVADLIATGFNVFAGTWVECSGPATVELVTVDWLRQLCGLPDTAGGLFLSGGSMANLTALALARHVKLGEPRRDAVIFQSDQTHSSVTRALLVLGFHRDQIHVIRTGDGFVLAPDDLSAAVEQERRCGRHPFCVVANAGTTNTGAVDPLDRLADLCAEEGLWLHADGAYGAAAVLCQEGRVLLRGMDRVDSLALDPHKWLFQPFETGCLLVREGAQLKQAFRILPEYLRDIVRREDEINFCDYGIQLTRSFRALKLWMSLKVFGLASFRAAVQRGLDLARQAETLLRDAGHWEIVSPARLGMVSFRYLDPALPEDRLHEVNEALVGALIEDGFTFLTSTHLFGRTALRLCTINPRTTDDDLRLSVERLGRLARSLAAG